MPLLCDSFFFSLAFEIHSVEFSKQQQLSNARKVLNTFLSVFILNWSFSTDDLAMAVDTYFSFFNDHAFVRNTN